MNDNDRKAYWRANLRLMAVLLTIWAAVSLGASILFVEQLNEISLGSFKLGFWMGQQGAIITFVALIGVYVLRMERLDAHYGLTEGDDEAHSVEHDDPRFHEDLDPVLSDGGDFHLHGLHHGDLHHGHHHLGGTIVDDDGGDDTAGATS